MANKAGMDIPGLSIILSHVTVHKNVIPAWNKTYLEESSSRSRKFQKKN